jgi:hypothetical protein
MMVGSTKSQAAIILLIARKWPTAVVILAEYAAMSRWPTIGVVLAMAILVHRASNSTFAQVTWNVDNTANIGGHAVTTVIGSPTVVSTPFGNGLKFDGNDGVIVDANPIAGATTFTIEMLFRPDPIVNLSSNVPRILHVQSSIPPDHRATLEGRIVNGQWYLDAFLRSQRPGQANASVVNSLTLIDATKLHPLGQWYNFTMTYDGEQLRAYLNGQLELAGPLAVLATASGQVSLGMRHNQVNFFEGVIANVRFTPSIVNSADFLSAYAAGDYDRDGAIDADDYDKWKSDFGSAVANLGDGADGNRNGTIDAADYTVWCDAFPAGAADAAWGAGVPEPTTLLLLIIGLPTRCRKATSRR